jgi:hypothetical protein
MYYMYTVDVNLFDIPNTHYTIKHLWALLQLLRTDSGTIQNSGRLPTADCRLSKKREEKIEDCNHAEGT